ncbi:MAG: nucleotidyltransferase domain-containing protein [Candidatus Nanoarchaeia archaeon]|nr:nucleotidyltransferase domain-containing protein [Candidatus Nanoarchaeia archaeon]
MRFNVRRTAPKNITRYPQQDVELARKFARIMYKEIGGLLSGVILFGSVARRQKGANDIDILVVLDDVRIQFSESLIQTYRILAEKAIADVEPKRLHIQTMKLTSFWEYAKVGDPVAVNILRYGIALIDTGFFDPLQALLDQGRIRPSEESVWTYFTMAPASLHRSKMNILTATVDLYWAAIDAAHAALMAQGEIPPTPSHVADMLRQHLKVDRTDAKTIDTLYNVFKGITHRDIKEVSGLDYDRYRKMAEKFVNNMKQFIESKR